MSAHETENERCSISIFSNKYKFIYSVTVIIPFLKKVEKVSEPEQCLVVPRKALFGVNDEYAFTGFLKKEDWNVDLEEILQKNSFYAPRKTTDKNDDVEYREDLKQIIPGVAFLYNDKIFSYARLAGSSEERLVGRNDILIAGHINIIDAMPTYAETFWKALHREFEEEVDYRGAYSLQEVGYVNCDVTSVDKVHFGLVYIIDGRSPDISVRETDALEGSLKSCEEIEKLNPPLKEWHKYVYENFVKGYLRK